MWAAPLNDDAPPATHTTPPASDSPSTHHRVRGIGTPHNPFAADFVQPGAIDWIATDHEHDLDELLHQLNTTHAGRAAITGPHGAGKTTLLTHLTRRAAAHGAAVHLATKPWPSALRIARRLPRATSHADPQHTPLLAIDSADDLPRWRWRLLHNLARRRRLRLLITRHRDLGLPTLHHRQPSPAVLRRILTSLDAHHPGAADFAHRFPLDDWLRHTGSVRHVLFRLYDAWESR